MTSLEAADAKSRLIMGLTDYDLKYEVSVNAFCRAEGKHGFVRESGYLPSMSIFSNDPGGKKLFKFILKCQEEYKAHLKKLLAEYDITNPAAIQQIKELSARVEYLEESNRRRRVRGQ